MVWEILDSLEKLRNQYSGQWKPKEVRECYQYVLGVKE